MPDEGCSPDVLGRECPCFLMLPNRRHLPAGGERRVPVVAMRMSLCGVSSPSLKVWAVPSSLAVELCVPFSGLSKLWCRLSIRERGWSTGSCYYLRPTPNHGHLHPKQNRVRWGQAHSCIRCALENYWWFSAGDSSVISGWLIVDIANRLFSALPCSASLTKPLPPLPLQLPLFPWCQLPSSSKCVRGVQLMLLCLKTISFPFRGCWQSPQPVGSTIHRYVPVVPRPRASWFTDRVTDVEKNLWLSREKEGVGQTGRLWRHIHTIIYKIGK